MAGFKTAGRLGAGATVLATLAGCVTTGDSGPSLARFNDSSDACQEHRKPLIATESRFGETMMAGAVLGGLAGAGVGAAVSDGDTGSILAGALIGSMLGGTLGYQEGLAQRHATRQDMLNEINKDASTDASRFSATRGLIGNLNACRNRQIDTIQANHDAGRITTPQARAQLDSVRLAVSQDNELIGQVLGHMTRRTDTYMDAARRTTDLDDGAILGATAGYTPGTIFWNEPSAAAQRMEVKATSANLRAGPGTSHRVVGGVRQGDVVTVAGRSGDWIRIAHDTEPAFIHTSLLSNPGASATAPTTAPVAAAVPVARSATPQNRPAFENDLQRAVVESRDTQAAGQQNHAQLTSRIDDMYTILGVN